MMSTFLTGMASCSTHPDVLRISECPGVAQMWVNVEERGRGLPGGVFPTQCEFHTVIYVVNRGLLGSTQMGVHLAEVEHRIKAPERLLLPIDDVLDTPRNVQLLSVVSGYRRIVLEEALDICHRWAAERPAQ
jgi:hypothetical protein